MEEKFCKVCGKKIENPRVNAKTCCEPECKRKYNIMHNKFKFEEKMANDPEYRERRLEQYRNSQKRRKNRLNELERQLLGYKVNELINKLKDTYFAGGCGGENLDKLLEVVRNVILDVYSIDDAIASLDDAEIV